MKRTIILLAACLLLPACASIPLGTLWKLRGFDENTLIQLEPADLRTALSLAPDVDVQPESVKLSLELARDASEPERHAFGLEPATGPGPFDRDRRYSLWQLDAAGRQALASVQRSLRAAQANDSKAYTGATFSVNFRPDFQGKPPEALQVTVQLLLTPEDGWLLLLDEAKLPITR
ncbi:hypothetical protein [Arenimonas donghaensis]|uniref:Uncharacterized protein n=1 Tax=Arenimonas donghaensis DSM 18148 = HO3-R19 TaxID=1121014 RepID=A0A087MJ35_9GAMM|nr:hypothetical protein [Arenimonas donghaensis]KFL36888.1 hypothetical protein N788_12230 [Arenimonas donghaensis DSM 18148 = HO3-R19]